MPKTMTGVSGCTIRSQSWSILFKFMREEESMEEPAWLALRSNSASVETGGGAVKGSNPSSPRQPLLRVRRK